MPSSAISPAQTLTSAIASRIRALRARLGAKWSAVLLAAPVAIFGVLHFGPRAGMVVAISVLLCMAAGILPRLLSGQPYKLLHAGSILTGLLLGLTLSADTPVYMIVAGALVAEIAAKAPFPWVSRPLFNPAAFGRGAVAILETLDPYPLIDAMNSASPLMVVAGGHPAPDLVRDLLLGFGNGAIGETSRLLLMLVGIAMLLIVVRKREAPLGLLLSVPLWVAVMPGTPQIYGHAPWALNPFIYLLGGSTLLMAFFFSTDPMTTPRTRTGGWIFGIGAGLIGVAGRFYTSIPGCEMWGVLIMNALTPAIDHIVERAHGLARTAVARSTSAIELAKIISNKDTNEKAPPPSFPPPQGEGSQPFSLWGKGWKGGAFNYENLNSIDANATLKRSPAFTTAPHDPITIMRTGLPDNDFAVLRDTLQHSSPAEVIEQVTASGLAGCGGAHFPAAEKWRLAKHHPQPRVLVINAQEGEPESFKDHLLVARDPLLMMEGAALAAYAIEAAEVILVVAPDMKAEMPALARAIQALHAACGDLLNIEFRLVVGPGLYVSGEESALLEFLKGRRVEPQPRPPYPSERGLFGRPTVVHNAETVSWLPRILHGGGEKFRQAGPLKLFSISGAVARPGVYAAALGTPLAALIEQAGGMAVDKQLHAIGVGGPSGGFLPANKLDMPLDAVVLAQAGAVLGTAAMRVVSTDECLVQLSLEALQYFRDESCGRCTPCRLGTVVLEKRVAELVQGKQGNDLSQKMEALSDALKAGSFCGLGRAAPNRLRSVIRYWPELIAAHMQNEKECTSCSRTNH